MAVNFKINPKDLKNFRQMKPIDLSYLKTEKYGIVRQ